jgi:hypothetical protein
MWHSRGAYTTEEVDRLYEAGKALEPLIEARASPFDDEWTGWQPEASLSSPVVPAGWQAYPGVEMTLGLGRAWDAWRPPPSP